MTDYNVRPATVEDCQHLAPRLRREDIEEVRAASGLEPLVALTLGLRLGECLVMECKGERFGLFGVCPTQTPGVGLVWMLATDSIHTHRTRFIRECRKWVKHLHTNYPVLWNYVDARNELHIRWLHWLGFEFIKLHPEHGVEKRPFIEFVHVQKEPSCVTQSP